MGMRNEYDNQPQPGVDRWDTRYFITVGYDF